MNKKVTLVDVHGKEFILDREFERDELPEAIIDSGSVWVQGPGYRMERRYFERITLNLDQEF